MAESQYSQQQIRDRIKHIWCNLTDEEISFHEGLKDVFFLAVRKKYGLPRAQAEEILRNFDYYHRENAA